MPCVGVCQAQLFAGLKSLAFRPLLRMRFIITSLLALSLLGCLATSWGEPSTDYEQERWRRTDHGWERCERWEPRIEPAEPPLHPAVVGVLQLLLVLTAVLLWADVSGKRLGTRKEGSWMQRVDQYTRCPGSVPPLTSKDHYRGRARAGK